MQKLLSDFQNSEQTQPLHLLQPPITQTPSILSLEDQKSLSMQKTYLNKRERLEQKHEKELNRCKEAFEMFLEKHGAKIPKTMNFNKVLDTVKTPFSSVPLMCQIKSFYLNYIMRYYINIFSVSSLLVWVLIELKPKYLKHLVLKS